MKKILICLLACLAVVTTHAVLKEKDLARTLGVLRAELAADYEKQQQFMTMYEQQGAQQHQQLVSYMTQCEQIGLMLYSQSTDYTFDMAYACQQATSLYRELQKRQGRKMQYDKMVAQMQREIERYDDLIATLKSMPPIIADGEEAISESDSILMVAIDSLEVAMLTHHEIPDSALVPGVMDDKMGPKDEEHQEPLYLSGDQLEDRKACLEYAQTMRDNVQTFLSSMEAESTYYSSVQEKVKKLNDFAQSRYKVLQDNIFRNGDTNYFSILMNLPRYISRAQSTFQTKYKPFSGHDQGYSEWRGAPVLFISIFLVIYFAIALLISYAILRWLLPKKWRTDSFKLKRKMLNNVVGIALFAIFVMIIKTQIDRNFIQMGTSLVINMAWLMEVIFLSLFIRLKGEHMRHAAIIYTPLMIMSFIVILFRIVLIPNLMANIIYPPILLGFTAWQMVCNRKYCRELPTLDRVYANICSGVMAISCIMAWVGYTLMAVQVMIWWTFQLAAIMTVTCLYDLLKMYELRYLVFRIAPQLKQRMQAGEEVHTEIEAVQREMREGKHLGKTWLYDLLHVTALPILGVGSVLFSLYQAGSVFEMTDMFVRAFMVNFVDQQDLIRISLSKLCLVAALYFIVKYINYALRNAYINYRRMRLKAGEVLNTTLGRNVIAILCWGLYAIVALVILNVPRSGISIVSAGLATGVGFAMQSILENFFYGISLMTGRLRVGDYIECDGVQGKVDSITYQSTQILTADGCVIAFLNSALFSKNFKNRTRNHNYEFNAITIGVAYGTDVNHVRELLVEAITPLCNATTADGRPITQPGTVPTVIISDFGDSSVDLSVRAWMLVEEKFPLTARIKEKIYTTLNENNIEIPFPQRDIHIR